MSLNPLTIAHLGIGRRPIVAALLGIWDELMMALATVGGSKNHKKRITLQPAYAPTPRRRTDDADALLLTGCL